MFVHLRLICVPVDDLLLRSAVFPAQRPASVSVIYFMRGACALREADGLPGLEEFAPGVEVSACPDDAVGGYAVIAGNAVAGVPVLDEVGFATGA